MKKTAFFYLVVTLMLLSLIAAPVFAESRTQEFSIEYDGSEIKTSDEGLANLTKYLNDIQPGDDATIVFKIKNASDKDVDWYLSNSAIAFEKSLNEASGAAYEYVLSYSGKTEPIFSSDSVGGTKETGSGGAIGVEEATENLDEFFLLDTLGAGQEATLTLYLALDGETQTNEYQRAISDITVNFAVEPATEGEDTHVQRIIYVPRTGDTSHVFLYVALEVISLIALIFVVWRFRVYRRKQEETR